MCGIVGVIQPDKKASGDVDFNRFFADALVAGTVRGLDSTGVFQIGQAVKDKERSLALYKKDVGGAEFLKDAEVQKYVNNARDSWMTIGHNRAATRGNVTSLNAHPFMHTRKDGTRLIGVHNGTLTSWSPSQGGKKFEVDSDWAIHEMMENGIAETLPKLQGAYAFVLYDEKTPDKFYIARNSGRPIHWAHCENRNSILIASEPEMLLWLAKRNHLAIEDKTAWLAKEHTLYTFDVADLREIDRLEYTPRAPAVVYNSGSYNNAAWNRANASWVGMNSIRNRIEAVVKAVMGGGEKELAKEIKSRRMLSKSGHLSLVPDPPTTSALGFPEVEAQYPGIKGVTKEEFSRLREIGITYASVAYFDPDGGWDEQTNRLHGSVVTDPFGTTEAGSETYLASIRLVNKAAWAHMQEVNPMEEPFVVKVNGAQLIAKPGDEGGIEVEIICTIPKGEFTLVSDESMREALDGHANN